MSNEITSEIKFNVDDSKLKVVDNLLQKLLNYADSLAERTVQIIDPENITTLQQMEDYLSQLHDEIKNLDPNSERYKEVTNEIIRMNGETDKLGYKFDEINRKLITTTQNIKNSTSSISSSSSGLRDMLSLFKNLYSIYSLTKKLTDNKKDKSKNPQKAGSISTDRYASEKKEKEKKENDLLDTIITKFMIVVSLVSVLQKMKITELSVEKMKLLFSKQILTLLMTGMKSLLVTLAPILAIIAIIAAAIGSLSAIFSTTSEKYKNFLEGGKDRGQHENKIIWWIKEIIIILNNLIVYIIDGISYGVISLFKSIGKIFSSIWTVIKWIADKLGMRSASEKKKDEIASNISKKDLSDSEKELYDQYRDKGYSKRDALIMIQAQRKKNSNESLVSPSMEGISNITKPVGNTNNSSVVNNDNKKVDVSINVDGSKDPVTTANIVKDKLQDELNNANKQTTGAII